MSDDNNHTFNSDFLSSLERGNSEIKTDSAEYMIEKTKASIEQAKASQEFLTALSQNTGEEWPQVSTRGFLSISGFGNGPGNKFYDWMSVNAPKFDWVNPAWVKKAGAGYEPWHCEYIGKDLFKDNIIS
jgi:hypothetical protein